MLEREALNDLKDDGDIIIKPAEKGDATIIMDTNHYESDLEIANSISRKNTRRKYYIPLRKQ